MPDRVTSYVFRGNFSNLGAGLTVMGKGVGDLGTKLNTLDRQGATARRGLTQLGTTAGRAGFVAAAGVAAVVLSAANFDQAMSNVAATGQEARDSLDELRAAAIQAGADTKFSAGEAAAGIENLLKAGVSAKDVLGGGLTGALNLAAAGGLDVASAAEIAATALTQFKLEGKDVPHVADLLAAAAGKAQGDVSDMSMALKQSGLVAAQMGVSIEETTGTLAAFASAGLLGSDAGTSFRTMLLRLANPTVESAKLMKQLGIEAYDAQGNFVGIESLAGQLQTAFEGQTQATRDAALATLFGSDAIRAANVLYNQGAQGISDWTGKVDDSGFAADQASIKMDNLKGDLEQLKGSLETALIGAGGSSQGPLRELVQGATKAVNAFSDLPGPVKSAATGLLAITAITGGGLWFGSKVIRGISDTKQALKDLGVSATTTSRAMKGLQIAGGVATGLALAATAIRAINDASRDSLPGIEQLTERLLNLSSSGDVAVLGDQFNDLGDDLDRLFSKNLDEKVGDTLFTPFKGILGETRDTQEALDEIEALDAALANLATSKGPEASAQALQSLADSGAITATQLDALKTKLPQYDEALAGLRLSGDSAAGGLDAMTAQMLGATATTDDASGATDDYAGALDGAGEAAGLAAEDIAAMVKAMQDQKDAAISAFDAETQYRQAMKDAAKQAKESNAGIKGSSDAALKNRDALGQLAARWNGLDQTVTDNVKKFKEARQNFIDTATAMGVPKAAAKALANQLLELPTKKVIPTSAPGAEAAAGDVEHLANQLNRLHDRTITVRVNQIGGVTSSAGGHSADPEQLPTGKPHKRTLGDLTTVSHKGLADASNAYAIRALDGLAKESDKAKEGTKGLKERLHDLENRLDRVSKAADDAHDSLDKLKSDRDALASSVSGSLEHDPFGGSLDNFNAQVGADTADAQAVLAALKQLVANGLDPHSALFKRLAASGNVSLIQEFAALSASQLAAEAAAFATGQGALGDVGAFAGSAAFDDLVKAQHRATNHLDNTVHHLAQQVNQLEKAVKDMPHKVKEGAHDGAKSGSREGSEEGTRAGQDERNRRGAAHVRTGG